MHKCVTSPPASEFALETLSRSADAFMATAATRCRSRRGRAARGGDRVTPCHPTTVCRSTNVRAGARAHVARSHRSSASQSGPRRGTSARSRRDLWPPRETLPIAFTTRSAVCQRVVDRIATRPSRRAAENAEHDQQSGSHRGARGIGGGFGATTTGRQCKSCNHRRPCRGQPRALAAVTQSGSRRRSLAERRELARGTDTRKDVAVLLGIAHATPPSIHT